MTSISYLGHNSLDHTVTFAISGVRYEYWLTLHICEAITYTATRISLWRALGLAKRRALRWEKLNA